MMVDKRALDPSCNNKAYQDELVSIVIAAERVADDAVDAYERLVKERR